MERYKTMSLKAGSSTYSRFPPSATFTCKNQGYILCKNNTKMVGKVCMAAEKREKQIFGVKNEKKGQEKRR